MVRTHHLRTFIAHLRQHRWGVRVCLLISTAVWVFAYPQSFMDLWLTRDQQGQVLFQHDQYNRAAEKFQNTHWQAYSFYGAEKYDHAALLYGQYTDAQSRLAQANALAHASRYIKARKLYRTLVSENPNNVAAKSNLLLIEKIIDDINRMSESQKPEGNSKELGDEAQRADGAEKKETRLQELEQYNADQLLLDPQLNAMWLRQVQKDPGKFLAQKFALQDQKHPANSKENSAGE